MKIDALVGGILCCLSIGFGSDGHTPNDVRYGTAQSQDIIKNIVSLVSKDSIRSSIKYMQTVGRVTWMPSNQDTLVPWLVNKFTQYGVDSVFRQPLPGGFNDGDNVIAIIKGSNANREKYCLFGGHSDQMGADYGGADDNASGCASVLEAARVLAKFEFKDDIRLAAFNGEEVGMNGSERYASVAKKNQETIIGGLINFDMIGYNPGGTARLYVHYSSNISGNKEFAELFKSTAALYVPLEILFAVDSDLCPKSDQSSFWNAGYVAFMGSETKDMAGGCKVYHSPGDTLDCPVGLNDSEQMTQAARCAIAMLAHLAQPSGTPVITLTHNVDKRQFTMRPLGPGRGAEMLFSIAENNAQVRVVVYTMNGKSGNVLTDRRYQKGTYTLTIPAALQATGMYIVDFVKNNQSCSQKFMLIR